MNENFLKYFKNIFWVKPEILVEYSAFRAIVKVH